MRFPPAVAAALGSLFLLLLPVILFLPGPTRGHTVHLARHIDCPGGFRDPFLLVLLPDGRFRFNTEEFPRSALNAKLRAVFEPRAERLLFVQAFPGTSFGDLAAAIDVAAGIVDHIAILTPSVEPCYKVVFPAFLDFTPNPLAERIKEVPRWPW